MIADTALVFLPLEAEIHTCFLPALLGIPSTKVDGEYCQLLTHSIKLGRLAIHNPMDTALSVPVALLVATCHLMVSLVDAQTWFNHGTHCICTTEAGQAAQKDWLQNEQIFLGRCGRGKPSLARRDKQNYDAGAWFLVFPNWLNSTRLLADKWRDNVCLRYNHSPLDILSPVMVAGLRCLLSMLCCARWVA